MADDTQSLADRELFIKEDLLPKISKMRRYLGNIDFNTEFYRRKRQGQISWEFEDRDTKTTFKTFIIGQIADPIHGTTLKGKGNYKAPAYDPYLALNDKTNVKNIVVLQALSGSNIKAQKAFLNQIVPLNNIFEHITKEDERSNIKPLNGNRNNWVETSAAADADNRRSDLIVVSLPKKFDAPKATTSSQKVNRVFERVPLTDEDDIGASTTPKIKEANKPEKVVVGNFYEPSLLPDYSPQQFSLVKNKLVQHDILDINDHLIPAWKIEQGLRSGTVILVSATLHVYNIDVNNGPGFRRYYQINAERIKVLAKPLTEEQTSTTNQHSVPQNPHPFDDFALFTKKRKDDEQDEDHATKKTKTEYDFEIMEN